MFKGVKGFCQNNNTIIYTSYGKNENINKFLLLKFFDFANIFIQFICPDIRII